MYATLEASTKNGMLTGSSTVTGNINEKTLRNIVMAYGGDANVMGNAWLYLNKKDLIAFGDLRGTNEKRYVDEITPNAQNPNYRHNKGRRFGQFLLYSTVAYRACRKGADQRAYADNDLRFAFEL